MAKRVKSDKPVLHNIANWEHADNFVRRIGELQNKIQAKEAKAKTKIDQAKANLVRQVKPHQETIEVYMRSLEAYAISHQDDLKKQKSRKLNFGVLGWRKSTSTSITKKTLELIREFFSKAKAATCIRVKESVDKEALARLTDEDLALVKAQRKSKEVFFVEPDLIEIADYNQEF